jgi:hypothetical protein
MQAIHLEITPILAMVEMVLMMCNDANHIEFQG